MCNEGNELQNRVLGGVTNACAKPIKLLIYLNLLLNSGANLVARRLVFSSWVCLPEWGQGLREFILGHISSGLAEGWDDCIVEIVMVTFTLRVLVAIFP